jgi:hypothetical protein
MLPASALCRISLHQAQLVCSLVFYGVRLQWFPTKKLKIEP